MASVRIYQKKEARIDRLSIRQAQMFKIGNVGTRQGATRVLDSRILKNSINSDASCTSPQTADSRSDVASHASISRRLDSSTVETTSSRRSSDAGLEVST